ncbi:hypothetical protein ABZP36_013380 [Zizania latifolia]
MAAVGRQWTTISPQSSGSAGSARRPLASAEAVVAADEEDNKAEEEGRRRSRGGWRPVDVGEEKAVAVEVEGRSQWLLTAEEAIHRREAADLGELAATGERPSDHGGASEPAAAAVAVGGGGQDVGVVWAAADCGREGCESNGVKTRWRPLYRLTLAQPPFCALPFSSPLPLSLPPPSLFPLPLRSPEKRASTAAPLPFSALSADQRASDCPAIASPTCGSRRRPVARALLRRRLFAGGGERETFYRAGRGLGSPSLGPDALRRTTDAAAADSAGDCKSLALETVAPRAVSGVEVFLFF